MFCRNCGGPIGNTESLYCGECTVSIQIDKGNVPQLNPVPQPNSYLVFNPDDGPFVWKVHGIADGGETELLVVTDRSSQSVMDAIAQQCPLEHFQIQGIKRVEGVVAVIQLNYEDCRLAEQSKSGPDLRSSPDSN